MGKRAATKRQKAQAAFDASNFFEKGAARETQLYAIPGGKTGTPMTWMTQNEPRRQSLARAIRGIRKRSNLDLRIRPACPQPLNVNNSPAPCGRREQAKPILPTPMPLVPLQRAQVLS